MQTYVNWYLKFQLGFATNNRRTVENHLRIVYGAILKSISLGRSGVNRPGRIRPRLLFRPMRLAKRARDFVGSEGQLRGREFQVNEFRTVSESNKPNETVFYTFPPPPDVTIRAITRRLDFLLLGDPDPRNHSSTIGRRGWRVARPRRTRRFPFGRGHTPTRPSRVFLIVAYYYCSGGGREEGRELPF